jgi:Zn-dependent protease/predicted transcriptional regulator
MKGSLKLFKWFGIPVFLHWSFGLILIYAFYAGYSEDASVFNAVLTLGVFIALFGCVLLHEFGHSLTALRYGVKTQDIILTPIGGIARLERMPEKPIQEFLVAIAGPLVNVVIAILLYILGKTMYSGVYWDIFMATITDQFQPITHFFDTSWDFIKGAISFDQVKSLLGENHPTYSKTSEILGETGIKADIGLQILPMLLGVNLWLVVFNMVPAFPMDGGRIFRSLLAMKIGRPKATHIASIVGQVIAVIFIVLGLFQGAFTLTLIGFFVFNNARSENRMVQTDDLLNQYKAKDMMRTTFTRIYLNDWMQSACDLVKQGGERNFLVFDMQDKIVGILDESAMIASMKKRDNSSSVSSYYTSEWETVDSDESLKHIYQLIYYKGHSLVPVATETGLVGVIDANGLAYFMNLQDNLKNKRS